MKQYHLALKYCLSGKNMSESKTESQTSSKPQSKPVILIYGNALNRRQYKTNKNQQFALLKVQFDLQHKQVFFFIWC